MILTSRPLHPYFVAEASGVDLRRPPSPELVRQVNAAMDQHAVLVFRGQPLTQDEQMAFTRAFGPLDLGFKRVKRQKERLDHVELADISNLAEDGTVASRDSRKIVSNLANQLWHSDSSFQQPAARYSLLHCVVTPERGGETEFADLRAAYDALPDEDKAALQGLEAEHYALHSRFLLGDEDYSAEQRAAIPPVHWPIVRTHPSGRRHLFLGVHARAVKQLTVAEGRMLLLDLLEHATRPEFVYRHVWQPGDTVIWDNRCTLHRGRRYDLSARRELRRSTTLDAEHPQEQAA